MSAQKRKIEKVDAEVVSKDAKCPVKHRVVPDGPMKCKWFLGTTEKSPHPVVRGERPKIFNDVLQLIGETPMVRLSNIMKEEKLECELLAKLEFMNPGGSVKDRIGRRMVEQAEKEGRIKPGDTLIEPTSGNTGIGLALAAALKGYQMIITLPEKMSDEKVNVLKALGAQIVRTPTEAAWDSPESHIGVAKRLNKEIPNSHILDQYSNPNNPLAHYDETAEEILEQCGGKLDMIVMTAGTGGTVTGIARKLKEKLPNIKVVAVDPDGSMLAYPDSMNGPIHSYFVEGIGYDFIPAVMDRDPSIVDEWVKSYDKPSFLMSRRLIRKEGILCGGSAGSACHAAIEACRSLKKGQRCVVLLADSVRNYMSKFLTDDWMISNNFDDALVETQTWWGDRCVGDLNLYPPCTIDPNVTCGRAIEVLSKEGYDQLPVVDEKGTIKGMVSEGNLLSLMIKNRIHKEDPVSKCVYKKFLQVPLTMKLSNLSKLFDREHFAVVVAKQQRIGADGSESQISQVVCGVVSRIDLVHFIANGEANVKTSSKP